jgi:hypothetical protein
VNYRENKRMMTTESFYKAMSAETCVFVLVVDVIKDEG